MAASSDAQQCERASAVAGVVTCRLGDICPAHQPQERDRQVTDRRHGPWSVSGSYLRVILVVRTVTHVMELVLDVPVIADQPQQSLGCRLLSRQAGDPVGVLDGHLAGLEAGRLTMDAKDLDGVREVQVALQFRAHPDRSRFDPTVALVRLAVRRGKKNLRPGPGSLEATLAGSP